jgi:hypothetical protein
MGRDYGLIHHWPQARLGTLRYLGCEVQDAGPSGSGWLCTLIFVVRRSTVGGINPALDVVYTAIAESNTE